MYSRICVQALAYVGIIVCVCVYNDAMGYTSMFHILGQTAATEETTGILRSLRAAATAKILYSI